ncbi:phosphoribosyltransferase [Vibrio ezurae]|uniref:Hypoxanthine-guanine phosphoribosyltransferase n=1 Tax=Vibrio ezurae NBRC 102218 TaxID=1219080 RepID=U3CE82_9VIBR|nr:phosphoribosyltransferase family protein [Vibrio ezurae]GAD79574.1 hypoxanthine-guanine phosphoribosyltransferase [Vibrio ezurae NBRC 102218]
MNCPHIGELVLSETQIQQGVAQIADELNALFTHAVVLTVVPGGIFFTADLVRKLKFDIKMDYISCPHTPGDTQNQSEIVFHENISLQHQNVIIVDDAIESGGTMKRLVSYLQQNYQMQSLSIATLFVKPGRVDMAVPEYYAYAMDSDDLLVGYGLPWEDKFRNVPYLSRLVK